MRTRFDPWRQLIIGTAWVEGPGCGVSSARGLLTGLTQTVTTTATLTTVALDTGAVRTVISADVLSKLGYDIEDRSLERKTVVGATGHTECPIIRVTRIRAFGLERKNLPVTVHTLPRQSGLDGLIGLDFLEGTLLTIDFVRSEVEIRVPGRDPKEGGN